MLILGKNTDDVGGQLEKLTKRLLENRGYKNIATDTIGEGGNEIDVLAEIPSRIPSSHASRRLIAECKAWAKPINLPDWLKFLGKIFTEEAKIGNEVEGLFVALSGVNGAVRGNYDSLTQRKKNVVLLESEQLTEEVSKLYNISPAVSIAAILKSFTEKQYSSMELAYYSEQFYLIFMFQDRDIAVLNANGEPADSILLVEIEIMLIKRLDAKRLIDLAAERLAQERARNSEKFLLTSIFKNEGKLPSIFVETEQNGFLASELKASYKRCESSGWVFQTDNVINLSFSPNEKTEKLIEVLRFLIFQNVKPNDWSELVNSKLFCDFLNEDFFNQISFIQAGLTFDDDFKSKLRLIAKISPSALAYAIHPDPMIVTSRLNQPETKHDDVNDSMRMMRNLLRSLRHDFNQGALAHYIYNDCKLREIEVIENYMLKDKDTIVLRQEVKQRLAIALGDHTLGSRLLYVELLNHAPEPWDLFAKS